MKMNKDILFAAKTTAVTAIAAAVLYMWYQVLYAVMGGNCL